MHAGVKVSSRMHDRLSAALATVESDESGISADRER
jgi:hypothetical protein